MSDEVYRKLKREKGDKSFSELIEERLGAGGKLADVTGQKILDSDTYDAVKEDIKQLSEGTARRLADESH